MDFDEQLAAGRAVPVDGWDFSWFEGHATEERPSWGYSGLAAQRLGSASASLDIETGGAEVYAGALAEASRKPARIEATEAWPPNLALARARLAPLGGHVAQVGNDDPLPFDNGAFDLVLSRLPSVTPWPEISRVLAQGGTFLSQQVVHGTNRELYEFLMGPQWVDPVSAEEHLVPAARAAGLEVVDFREESPKVEFFDLASVVVFLRKVVWTVPDFTVERYRDRLRELHERIATDDSFVSHSRRALIEAVKP